MPDRQFSSRLKSLVATLPKGMWLTLIVFACIYSSISLVNHALFKTAALDLGMMNHALHSFSEFKSNTFTLYLHAAEEKNFFGTHFSPIMFLYVPLHYLLGSYTLLLIQLGAILMGGVGMFRWMKAKSQSGTLSILTAIHFYSIWGIYSALAFDFHNNVVGAMLVPWLVHAHERRKFWNVVGWSVLIVFCQEHMALWLVFLFLGLTWLNWSEARTTWLRFELPLVLGCGLYFLAVLGWAMPWAAGEATSSQLERYAAFGDGPLEIAWHLISHPWATLQQLVVCSDAAPALRWVKAELHVMVLLAGGWAFFYRPQYLLMLLPIYLQKLLTSNPDFWGISYQYSIEFVPILALAVAHALSQIRNHQQRLALGTAACVLTITSTVMTMKDREAAYSREKVDFLYAPHYRTEVDVEQVCEALAELPEGAALSVSSRLAPHLADRDRILLFPQIEGAEYVVIFTDHEATYPLSQGAHRSRVEAFRASTEHEVVHDQDGLLVVRLAQIE